MANVTYKLNQSHRQGYKRRFRVTAVITIISLIILAILCLLFLLFFNKKDNSQSPVGNKIVSRIAGPKLFKNQFFEFYSSDDWRLDAADSGPSYITYVLYGSGVVSGSFIVYVNDTPIPDKLGATIALPVTVEGGKFGSIGSLSGSCGQTYAVGELKRIKEISIDSTSILCVPDSSEYKVILGNIGGDYNLKMTRSSGQVANYIIIYTSSTFTPSSASFMNLIPTFKSL